MKTYWVGEDDPVNTPTLTMAVEPTCTKTVSEHYENDVIDVDSQTDDSQSQQTQTSQYSCDLKLSPESGSKDCASYRTRDTEKSDSLSDNGASDHYISVHTQHEYHPTKILMDGSLEPV